MIVHSILLASGLLLCYLGYSVFQKTVKFLNTGNRARATVSEVKKEFIFREKDYEAIYTPVFRFTTPEGKEILYEYNVSSSKPEFKAGDTVMLAYKTGEPEKPMLLSYYGTFLVSLLLLLAGSPLVVIGGSYVITRLFL